MPRIIILPPSPEVPVFPSPSPPPPLLPPSPPPPPPSDKGALHPLSAAEACANRALLAHALASPVDLLLHPLCFVLLPGGPARELALMTGSVALAFWVPMAVAMRTVGKMRQVAAEAAEDAKEDFRYAARRLGV